MKSHYSNAKLVHRVKTCSEKQTQKCHIKILTVCFIVSQEKLWFKITIEAGAWKFNDSDTKKKLI